MSVIYKWKKYAVNIPDAPYETIAASGSIGVIYGDSSSKPLLVLEKDIKRIPGLWNANGNIREEVLFVIKEDSVIQELQPDVLYPYVSGQVLFPRYSPNGYCATHYGKSVAGYWKYNGISKSTKCIGKDGENAIDFFSVGIVHADQCTKGAFIEEVSADTRDAYPDDGIAPMEQDPAYGTEFYWYEYAGEEEYGTHFPEGGFLEQFENSDAEPVFPLTVVEGIFRQSDGKSLEAILRSISAGGTGSTGAGLPDGGTTGQLLAKKSAADYDAQWVDPPEDGSGSTAGVSSFNGRSGAVSPKNGDYTAAMVGAIPADQVKAILPVTQSQYDALASKDAGTLYLIKEYHCFFLW